MICNNVKVYGIEDSFKASKYPMAIDVNAVNGKLTDTITRLASTPIGSGHDNFLNGIIVQFDLTLPIKVWVEAQRYHFLDFVSSQSTMHCISKFDVASQCDPHVSPIIIDEVNRLKEIYMETKSEEDYLNLLYNIPVGFNLTARMTTNYRQLKTIYAQRKTHRLPQWRKFCKWIETLPYASELICN